MDFAIDIIEKNFSVIGTERKKIMSEIIFNYSSSENPFDILGVAYALYYSGAKYRSNAIEFFEKYLSAPADISKYKMISLWGIYSNLSTLYEKEYQYEKAIYYLKMCIESNGGNNPADFTRIGDILIKIDLDRAEDFYISLLSNNDYTKFRYQFEYALNDIHEKQRKGYKYNPRPQAK